MLRRADLGGADAAWGLVKQQRKRLGCIWRWTGWLLRYYGDARRLEGLPAGSPLHSIP